MMDNWEIGRAQGTKLKLSDLKTENLIERIRHLVWYLEETDDWNISKEDRKFLEHYDKYRNLSM
jgi:hypothetical protein